MWEVGVAQMVTGLQLLEHHGQTLPEEEEDINHPGPWALALGSLHTALQSLTPLRFIEFIEKKIPD